MEYAVILIAVLLLSPFILTIASSQNKKTKYNLRVIFLLLLASQILLGFLNWEAIKGPGRSGFELAIVYSASYLWLFFIISSIQIILLIFKKSRLDTVGVVLNFINTIIFFAAMIMLSKILSKQIVSLASIGAIFLLLMGNVTGLMLINKDKNLLRKYL